MTAIVYDHKNKQIAVDSRCCANGQIKSDSDVKYKLIDGAMWFFCGSVADEERLIAQHESESPDTPRFRIEASAMVVRDGKAYIYGVTDDGEPFKSPLNYNDCLGSGGLFSLCALDFGLSAYEAIEYAKTKDSGVGGTVHVFNTESMEFVCSQTKP